MAGTGESTGERMRRWNGPALFSYGFRPMFLLAGLASVAAMALWVAMLTGRIDPPRPWDGVGWHVHAFLFGYMGAVLAGFLLTAVPNWTGRMPVVGWPLAALAVLWLVGALLHWFLPACGLWIEPAFLPLLSFLLWREIIAGNNRRNIPVAALVSLLALAHIVFDLEVATDGAALDGAALRTAIAAVVLLVSLIGGRVTPSFTRNWLVQRRDPHLPTPFGRFDRVTMGLSAAGLLGWVLLPQNGASGALLLAAGLAHLVRLARWKGARTFAEPLVLVLHVAYFFVPVGFVLTGLAALTGQVPAVAGLHGWLVGAMGMMTLAVMTRASLGHTGRPLHAGPSIAAIYVLVLIAALARIAAAFSPGNIALLELSATAWIAAFALFVLRFAPVLLGPRPARRRPGRSPGGAETRG